MKSIYKVGIGIAAIILIVGIILAFNKCGTKRTELNDANLAGQNTILTEKVTSLESINKSKDSTIAVLQSEKGKYITENYRLEQAYNSIKKASQQAKQNVAQLTNDESVDFFKEGTKTPFETIRTDSLPVVKYAIPIKAIKNANESFVALDEEMYLNDNLVQQVFNLRHLRANCDSTVTLLNEKCANFVLMGETKDRIILNKDDIIKGNEKLLRKEKRKTFIYKGISGLGILGVLFLVLR